MIRRSLFLGFMIVLGSVLLYLVLSARKQEKRVASRPTEIVRASKLSATRVISPVDIEITGIRTERAAPGTDEASSDSASVRSLVTIRNRGQVAFDRFMVRLVFTSRDGREESRSQVVSEKVPAGATVTLPEITVADLSDRRAKARADIVWADLVSSEPPGPPPPPTQ